MMTHSLSYLSAAIGIAMFAPSLASAQAPDKSKGYEAFKLIRTRNIFDPNRRAMVSDAPQRSNDRPRNRSSSITLTGTLVSDGRLIAFFGSSRPEFSKVAKVGESVGDYKVASIGPAQVELERDGKKSTLALGRQLNIEGVAGAEPVEEEVPAASGTSDNPAAKPASPTTGTSPASEPNDVLRRMMERRQKELSK